MSGSGVFTLSNVHRMTDTMHKTPSYLKGLAETRARAAGEVERYEAVLNDVGARLVEARKMLEAADRMIRQFDSRLDPTLIPTIRTGRGYPGGRGALRGKVIEILSGASPAAVTTSELSWSLILAFLLDFPSAGDRRKWVHNSLTPLLKDLIKEGLVERLHSNETPTGEAGHWRWKAEVDPSLDRLRERVEAQGVSAHQSDAVHE